MTEPEWLSSTDPAAMLDWMTGRVSDRKARLFACACCRLFQRDVGEEQFVGALETAELFADGESNKAALKRARQGVRALRHGLPAGRAELHAKWAALWLAEVTNSENAFRGVAQEIERLASQGLIDTGLRSAAAELLRCILGNPFRSAVVQHDWQAPDVVALANTIYDERAIERLPDLADALNQVGCSDENMLTHSRSPGPHVKGCWVVDVLLGQS